MTGKIHSKDAFKVLNYDITTNKKGILVQYMFSLSIFSELLYYRYISKIIRHSNGIEIITYDSPKIRIFYNDDQLVCNNLYLSIVQKMETWMNSNYN